LNFIYSAGKEGSLFIWSYDEISQKKLDKVKYLSSSYEKLEALPDIKDEDVPFYLKVIEDEDDELQKEKREEIRIEMRHDVNAIYNELKALLLLNEEAEEIEKVDRMVFVLDNKRKDLILKEGDK